MPIEPAAAHYNVLDAQGLTMGTVENTATTSMRPPCKTTCWVVQKGIVGNAVVNKQVWLCGPFSPQCRFNKNALVVGSCTGACSPGSIGS